MSEMEQGPSHDEAHAEYHAKTAEMKKRVTVAEPCQLDHSMGWCPNCGRTGDGDVWPEGDDDN